MNIGFINSSYQELATQIHAFNVAAGWWDKHLHDKAGRFEEAMMLVFSEVAEAMEGLRKDLDDDKLPCYKMYDVELADTMIRLLDLAGAYGVDVGGAGLTITSEIPKRGQVQQLYFAIKVMSSASAKETAIRYGIALVHEICRDNDIELRPIMAAKMEFNATRADHKPENRAKDGGKKF